MIIRSTDPQEAADELEILKWIVGEVGEDDTAILASWIHDREAPHGRYMMALATIVESAAKSGAPKLFLGRLIAQARKPAIQREAEVTLMQAMLPHLDRLRATVQRHHDDPLVREEVLREVRVRLRETLHRLFPDKHRASIDGAIIAGTSAAGATLNFGVMVDRLMNHQDPLASTAAASHAVTDDR